MKVAVLTANLGNFDNPVALVPQDVPEGIEVVHYRFTDDNFPPIIGLTPRLQYRIPKLFGWQMFPGHDVYIWYDSSMSLQHTKSVEWFLNQLGDNEMALFKHPWRKTIKEEVDHVEEKLNDKNRYILSRYANGLHKEQYAEIKQDKTYVDDILYTSTAFVYKNTAKVQAAMKLWWYHQSRYFTVDQIALPYVVHQAGLKVRMIPDNQFKSDYITLVSRHK